MTQKAREDTGFRLTYATMFDPPPELHDGYDQAVQRIKAQMGANIPMLINGEDVYAEETIENRSPVNQDWILGIHQRASEAQGRQALEAARQAFPIWSQMDWRERVARMRDAADRMTARIFELGAIISLEAGKNRMEALGDAAEAPDLIRYACDQMEANNGFMVEMGKDPLTGYEASNVSILRPHGVWLVISPFNFPAALSGGPMGAALVAGNTVVLKPAEDTPWTSRVLVECLRDAGLPPGAVNYVTGSGRVVGEAMVQSGLYDGVTFTGSYEIGMHIYRTVAQGRYPKPTILEMGGKNPTIVSRNADLERAVTGIVRSAFGAQGQKCSAASRVYIEAPVYDELVELIVARTQDLTVGDPTEREVFMGPVINQTAYNAFKGYTEELSDGASFLTGGQVLSGAMFDKGFYCQPTVVAGVPEDHRLWSHEMFLPITMVHPVESLDQAMTLANAVDYGLTAGFYGSEDEATWFFENIEAGVNYANRPQGATTGAWPGYQPFGGWKASGSTGKNAGGHYYLQLYMREKIHTIIR